VLVEIGRVFDTAQQLQLLMNFKRLKYAIQRHNVKINYISCIFAFCCFCFACVLAAIGRCFRYRTAVAADDEFLNVLNAQSGVKILNFRRFYVYLLFAAFALLVYLLRSCVFGECRTIKKARKASKACVACTFSGLNFKLAT
jgi:hypothetical protein